MRPTLIRTGLISVFSAMLCVPAIAQYKYIDSTNPTGLPDLTQNGLGGICAASSMANALWEWSNHAPFNNANNPLVTHTNQANFATKWGADSRAMTLAVANKIYGAADAKTGARTGGLGTAAGVVRYAADRNLAYNKNNRPTGLSVEATFGWENIRYSQLNNIVQNEVRNAVLGIKWYTADDMTVKRPDGSERYHAVTLAGMDNTLKGMAISNPWGDHSDAGDTLAPVSTTYYDKYWLDLDRLLTNDRAVIKGTDAGNAAFVGSFDTATQNAATVWPTALWQIRRGGSPNVVANVTNDSGLQRVRYTVENPDSPDPIHNAYMLMDPAAVDIFGAYTAAQSWLLSHAPEWSVTLLDPNTGSVAELFAVTGESDPSLSEDYALEGWQSGAAGLMFTSAIGLTMSESVELGFDLPGFSSPLVWNNVYAVSNLTNTHAWYGVTIPAPGSLMLLGLAIWTRRRRA